MKKNLIPLVIIALVVAVVSTGIFYGLIVSRMDGSSKVAMVPRYVAASALEKGHVLKTEDFRLTNVAATGLPGPQNPAELEGRTLLEDLTPGKEFLDSVLSPLANRPLQGGIPAGQRAVTVHITEASSVVQMLKTGDHVDVQALLNRNRNGESDLELRTILQNATVFTIASVDHSGTPQGRSILTLLASPQDAERLTLADAGARMRIVLRSRGDQTVLPLNTIQLSNLTQAPRNIVSEKAVEKPVNSVVQKALVSSQLVAALPPVEVQVELVEVASDEIAGFAPSAREGVFQISTTAASVNASETVSQLKASQKLRVLASAKLLSGRGSEFSWRSGEMDQQESSLRLRVETSAKSSDGLLHLTLKPESSSPKSGALATRSIESSVSLGARQAAIVSGLFTGEEVDRWRSKLTDGTPGIGGKGELMLVIVPGSAAAAPLAVKPVAGR